MVIDFLELDCLNLVSSWSVFSLSCDLEEMALNFGYFESLNSPPYCPSHVVAGLEVIKLEFILRLKIKRYDWLLADTCPQSANHCALF